MKYSIFAVGMAALALAGCSRSDQQKMHESFRETGQKIKKELHQDATFMRKEAEKARVETKKGVTEIKKKAAVETKSLRERKEREKPADQ